MRWPIRNQILLPFAVVQTIAVAVLSLSAAWMAADRAEKVALERLERVVATLGNASFPIRTPILEQMKGLSGADFIASDASLRVTASTLTDEQARLILAMPRSTAESGRLGRLLPVKSGEQAWLVGAVEVLKSPELKQLLVLVPEQQWQSLRREVILPPLMIGAATLLLMVTVSFWLAARMGGRLKRMQQHVQQLASCEFDQLLPTTGDDELQELAASINRMAQDLQFTTRQIRINERTSLITQVAGGLAHQLRNSITGAKMAVQLHVRRCQDIDRESLNVAIRQLSLTENQIRGLLRLTRDVQQPLVPGRIDHILQAVQGLLEPQCAHSDITLSLCLPSADVRENLTVADAEQMQASLLNLVQNAVEAAGPGGRVQVEVSLIVGSVAEVSVAEVSVAEVSVAEVSVAEVSVAEVSVAARAGTRSSSAGQDRRIRIEIYDSGPGVSAELGSRIFEPFVTGKSEGVGLGLTLAAQTAEEFGGSLQFDRVNDMTRFRFEIQAQRPSGE